MLMTLVRLAATRRWRSIGLCATAPRFGGIAALQLPSLANSLSLPVVRLRRGQPALAHIPRYHSLSTISSRYQGEAAAEREVKTLLIVYHTLTDGTRQMAQAAYEAADAAAKEPWDEENGPPPPEIRVRFLRARDAGPEDILSASAYIFATPENLATMAGIMKDFFDRCFYYVLGKTNGRAYAVMICAGSDGQGAMRQLDRICTGWRLKKVADGIIIITHAQTAETCLAMKHIPAEELVQCAEIGSAMVEGLRLGVY